MARKPPEPRYLNSPYWGLGPPTRFPDGTWLEAEAFAYPGNTLTRRAYATFPDGRKRICFCKVADTYFTIPARAMSGSGYRKGYLSVANDHLIFMPTKE